MPKVKSLYSESKRVYENVKKNIAACAAFYGCKTFREFEKRTGIAKSTVCRRSRNPQMWTLEQLVKIAAAFNVTPEWLMSDHSKEL